MQFIDLQTQFARIQHLVRARIEQVLQHGQFILGPEVQELEEQLADFIGVRHCIGMSSGTDALLASLLALEIGQDDEVITPAFSFIATAEVIALVGAKPIWIDIDPATYTLDPAQLENSITSRTRAIIPVSLYGQCAAMDQIEKIAQRHDLPVIEDAAQSFGARYHGRASGGLSLLGCTSFFPAKPLGAYGDAGACFTNDDTLAHRLREIRHHGQDRRYHHSRLGLNARLDTIQAAILLAKLTIFPAEIQARVHWGTRYTELLNAHGAALTSLDSDAAVLTPFVPSESLSIYAQYTIQVKERDQVAARLQKLGIPTAVHYPLPLNQQPVFQQQQDLLNNTPVSSKLAQRVLSLPMHPYLTEEIQDRIVAAVIQVTELKP